MYKIFSTFISFSLCIMTLLLSPETSAGKEVYFRKASPQYEETIVEVPIIAGVPLELKMLTVLEKKTDEEITLSDSEIELIALVTMAEAEGECEEGKRLVIDTILNRMDSEYFPDTPHDVIYQPHQFSSMWNGRVDRCEVREDICQLVKEELKSRLNYDVMFFTAGCYGNYGVPMFQIENHYFSSYK